jgi:hypothetical protein
MYINMNANINVHASVSVQVRGACVQDRELYKTGGCTGQREVRGQNRGGGGGRTGGFTGQDRGEGGEGDTFHGSD